jgi:hypothetical protein
LSLNRLRANKREYRHNIHIHLFGLNSHSHFDLFWTHTWHIYMHINRDQGLTPEIPRECSEKLAQLMKVCWNKDPNQRPVSSFLISISIFSNCVCFDLWNSNTHSQLTFTLKRSEMSFSLNFFLIVVFLDLKHTNWKSFETICAMLQQQRWSWYAHSNLYFLRFFVLVIECFMDRIVFILKGRTKYNLLALKNHKVTYWSCVEGSNKKGRTFCLKL